MASAATVPRGVQLVDLLLHGGDGFRLRGQLLVDVLDGCHEPIQCRMRLHSEGGGGGYVYVWRDWHLSLTENPSMLANAASVHSAESSQ
jgi:hypothetical protein